jgi:hypothetical protein
MAENNTAGEDLRNPHVRHEPGDVNAVFLTKFGIGMAFLIVVFLFGLWGLFEYFVKREAALSLPSGAFPVSQQKLPPEPRLQPKPALDMQQMRAAEERTLHQYGWVDPDKGIVRIPIDRAMDIIAKKGLPVASHPGVPSGEKTQ